MQSGSNNEFLGDEGVLKANLMTILRTQHQPKDDENDKNYFFDIEVKH